MAEPHETWHPSDWVSSHGPSRGLRIHEDPAFDVSSLQPLGKYLDNWYERFTCWCTFKYVAQQTGPIFIFYVLFTAVCVMLALKYSEEALKLEAAFALKVLTFLVGLLISLTLKEALDRHKHCMAALIEFREEFLSFWYFAQLPLRSCPAGRLLLDIHMTCYSLSLVRFLLMKANIQMAPPNEMVQPEFANCLLFHDDVPHDALCSNPTYAEMLLIAWLRAMGIYNGEMRLRFKWARRKLHALLTAQRVKTPRTSVHLLRTLVHVFLLAICACSPSSTTKCSAPLIALVLFPLLGLAEELEDPFGLDEHDLPWPLVLGTITHCYLSPESVAIADEAIAFFNGGCATGTWDSDKAECLFGKGTRTQYDPSEKPLPDDSGSADLTKYLSEPCLHCLDVVGDVSSGNPETLFHYQGIDDADSLSTTLSGDEVSRSLLSDTELSDE